MLATALVSGLSLGSIYGLIALGFTLTFAVSGTVNFAQGSSVMLGAVLCHALVVGMHWPMVSAIPVALLVCAIWGLVVERIAVRPFVARGTNSWLMATVALGIVLDNVVMVLFGKEPRALPSALADDPWVIGNVGIFPLQILVPVVGLGLAPGPFWNASNQPRAEAAGGSREPGCRAADEHRCDDADRAHLCGGGASGRDRRHSDRTIYNVAYDMGTLFGIKAFAVAILGGLTNPWGVVIAGLAYGLVEACATTWLGSSSTQIVTFTAVIAALALAPSGLFGGRTKVRV